MGWVEDKYDILTALLGASLIGYHEQNADHLDDDTSSQLWWPELQTLLVLAHQTPQTLQNMNAMLPKRVFDQAGKEAMEEL